MRSVYHPKLDKEALRILNLMETWKPDVRNGKIVKIAIVITIGSTEHRAGLYLNEEQSYSYYQVDKLISKGLWRQVGKKYI